jgi:hypothetical protein
MWLNEDQWLRFNNQFILKFDKIKEWKTKRRGLSS